MAASYAVESVLGLPHLRLPEGRRVRPLKVWYTHDHYPGVVIVPVAGGGVVHLPIAEAKRLRRVFGASIKHAAHSLILTNGGAGRGSRTRRNPRAKYPPGSVRVGLTPGRSTASWDTQVSGIWSVSTPDGVAASFFDLPTGYPRKGGSGKGAAINAAFVLLGHRKISDAEMRRLLVHYPGSSVPDDVCGRSSARRNGLAADVIAAGVREASGGTRRAMKRVRAVRAGRQGVLSAGLEGFRDAAGMPFRSVGSAASRIVDDYASGRREVPLPARRNSGLLSTQAEITLMRALWKRGGEAFDNDILADGLDVAVADELTRRGILNRKTVRGKSPYGVHNYAITDEGIDAMLRAGMQTPGLWRGGKLHNPCGSPNRPRRNSDLVGTVNDRLGLTPFMRADGRQDVVYRYIVSGVLPPEGDVAGRGHLARVAADAQGYRSYADTREAGRDLARKLGARAPRQNSTRTWRTEDVAWLDKPTHFVFVTDTQGREHVYAETRRPASAQFAVRQARAEMKRDGRWTRVRVAKAGK